MAENGFFATYINYTAPGSSSLGQIPMGAVHDTLSGTAAQHRVTDRATAGTLKNFYLNVITNANVNSITVAVRKNGSIGNLSISVGSSVTGLLSDLSGSDSIADGDTFNHTVSTGASATAFIAIAGVQWETSGQFAFQPAAGLAAGTTFSTASTAFYLTTYGRLSANTTENFQRLAAIGATTISKLQVYVSGNGRSTDTTFVSRNNGGNGNQSVTVAGGATGLFEDTSNTDSVSDGNYFSIQGTTGTGTGTLTIRYASFKIATSTANWCPIYGGTGAGIAASASVQRAFVSNTLSGGTPVPYAARASLLYIDVTSNTVSAASSCTLRVGGSPTSLSASITANTTGRFADVTNIVQIVAADLIDADVTAGGTGTTLTFREFGMLLDAHKTLDTTAALAAQSSTMSGALEVEHPMTGVLQAQSATLAADLEVGHDIIAALQSQSASLSASLTVVHTITAALEAQSATLAGDLAVLTGVAVTVEGELNAQSAELAGILVVGGPLDTIRDFYLLGGRYNIRVAHPDPGLVIQLQQQIPGGSWIDVSIPIIGNYDTSVALPPGTYRFIANVVGTPAISVAQIYRRGPL